MTISYGLDFGTSSIKLVGLEKTNKGFSVSAIAIAANPIGRLLPTNSEENVRLAEVVKKLIKDSRAAVDKVRVGLAESQVYTRVIQVPVLSEAELASAIRWEAEQHIPVPVSEVQLDYTVLSRPEVNVKDGLMDILLVAAKRTTVGQMVDFVKLVGLELTGIETGLLCASRALSGVGDPPTMLMHVGASSSDFAVLNKGKLVLTYSSAVGGAALTKAIEVELELAPAQAEQYKRAYGLKPEVLEGRVRNAILPVFNNILTDAKKTINSFESTQSNRKINRILISGGSALLPNISAEIANRLGVAEVIVGNPFYLMTTKSSAVIPNEVPVYSVAVGLGRGGL